MCKRLVCPHLSGSGKAQRRSGLVPVEGPVDGRAEYGKYLGQVPDGVFASGVHAAQLLLLLVGQLRLLAAQFTLGAGDGHAHASAHSDQIGFELSKGGEDVRAIPAGGRIVS